MSSADKDVSPVSDSSDYFEHLLNNLADERDEAGKQYAKLRDKLENYFYLKGLSAPDYAADLTLEKLGQILYVNKEPIDDVNSFAFGIAKNIFFEQRRIEIKQRQASEDFSEKTVGKNNKKDDDDFKELAEMTISMLDIDEQELLFNYYANLPFAECVIEREKLASTLNTNVNNLRQRVSTIKRRLEKIIETKQKSGQNRSQKTKKNLFRKFFSK